MPFSTMLDNALAIISVYLRAHTHRHSLTQVSFRGKSFETKQTEIIAPFDPSKRKYGLRERALGLLASLLESWSKRGRFGFLSFSPSRAL